MHPAASSPWILATALAVGLAGAARAEAPSASALARELLVVSGLDGSLESMAPQAIQGVAHCGVTLPAPIERRLTGLIHREFEPRAVRLEIVSRIVADMDRALAEESLAFYRTPLARRLKALEEHVATPAGQAGLERFIASGVVAVLPPSRIALIDRLDRVTETTEFTVDLVHSIPRALVLAAADPSLTALGDMNPILSELERQRIEAGPRVRSYVRTMMHYAYRDVPDADLVAYVAFFESEAGRWSNRALSHALVGTMNASATRIGVGLRREIRALQTAPARPARGR